MQEPSWNRRAFVGTGLGAVASTLLLPELAAAEDVIPTFALDPNGAVDCKVHCGTCTACALHAANKLFRTELAATSGRAHLGCNCAVVLGQPLSATVHKQLFDTGGATDVADRRYAFANQVLNAGANTHSVPMLTGIGPAAVVVGGAAGIVLWTARRRGIVGPS